MVTARLSQGEDLYECIEGIARKEKVKSAVVFVVGGLEKANVVVGPRQIEPEIVGDFREFVGPGEVMGVGTIFWDDEGPKLHLHSGIGKGEQAIVGCPRGGAEVFLVLEVTIIEIEGIKAQRKYEPSSGLKLLQFD